MKGTDAIRKTTTLALRFAQCVFMQTATAGPCVSALRFRAALPKPLAARHNLGIARAIALAPVNYSAISTDS
jgi:hypothetical protein